MLGRSWGLGGGLEDLRASVETPLQRWVSAMGEETENWILESLEALAFANRLTLLSQLQDASTLDEIELTPVDHDTTNGNRARCLTRQGVRYHLNQLQEAGIVRAERVREGGRVKNAYSVDQAPLWALSEALRELSANGNPSVHPEDPDPSPITWGPAPEGPGAHLVVVHGLEIGRRFRLGTLEADRQRGWILGSQPKADVPLPASQFVDDQAAEIEVDDGEYTLLDLRSAQTRVSLNGERLELGERRPLAHGDVIGVGHTQLLFRE
jgi:DNA-binding transcriptional ArsR family regulator